MKGIIFTKGKIIAYVSSTVIISIILALSGVGEDSFKECFVYTFGYVELYSTEKMMNSLVLWFMPQLVFIIFLGDYFEKKYLFNACIVFSRTNNYILLIKKVMLEIAWLVIIGSAIIFSIFVTIYCAMNGKLDIEFSDITDILLYILFVYITVLGINVLTLICSSNMAGIVVLISQVFLLQVVKMIKDGILSSKLFMFNPMSLALFYQQEQYNVHKFIYFGYGIFLVFIMAIISNIIMRKKEFYQ